MCIAIYAAPVAPAQVASGSLLVFYFLKIMYFNETTSEKHSDLCLLLDWHCLIRKLTETPYFISFKT